MVMMIGIFIDYTNDDDGDNYKRNSTNHLKLTGVLDMSSTAEVSINTRYCHKSHLVFDDDDDDNDNGSDDYDIDL